MVVTFAIAVLFFFFFLSLHSVYLSDSFRSAVDMNSSNRGHSFSFLTSRALYTELLCFLAWQGV